MKPAVLAHMSFIYMARHPQIMGQRPSLKNLCPGMSISMSAAPLVCLHTSPVLFKQSSHFLHQMSLPSLVKIGGTVLWTRSISHAIKLFLSLLKPLEILHTLQILRLHLLLQSLHLSCPNLKGHLLPPTHLFCLACLILMLRHHCHLCHNYLLTLLLLASMMTSLQVPLMSPRMCYQPAFWSYWEHSMLHLMSLQRLNTSTIMWVVPSRSWSCRNVASTMELLVHWPT